MDKFRSDQMVMLTLASYLIMDVPEKSYQFFLLIGKNLLVVQEG